VIAIPGLISQSCRVKKPGFFKKPNPVGYGGFYWVLGFYWVFGQARKIGKIIQKLSNLKP